MNNGPQGAIEVEAELVTPSGTVQLVRYHFMGPPDSRLHPDGKFRIELCLTARHQGSRASFPGMWPSQRFERIGDLFVAPPNVEMLTRSDEAATIQAVVCELRRDVVLELFDHRPELTEAHLLGSLDVRHPKLRGLLLQLADEARRPGFASEFLADLLTKQVAVEMVRHGARIVERGPNGGLASWQLRLVDERLQQVREAPTIAYLADLCQLSVRQLSRCFRASRGCSLGAYVSASQMEHAKALLAIGAGVAEIATTLGFASSSNFCFAFRRATGMTPGHYRQVLRRH
jgi:AraC family transcriptional regulator